MSEPAPLLAPSIPERVAPRLWRDGRFAADDWHSTADADPLPIGGRAILSLARWRAAQADLGTLGVPLGVRLEAGQAIEHATDGVARLDLVALAFPKFSDGRAYSVARRLREAGFRGEIRATGDILIDQMPLMLRAGFDAFEVSHAATVRALELGQMPAVTRVYQRNAAHGTRGLWQARGT